MTAIVLKSIKLPPALSRINIEQQFVDLFHADDLHSHASALTREFQREPFN